MTVDRQFWVDCSPFFVADFEPVRHHQKALTLAEGGACVNRTYYVANKFIKGYLGTANIDTNSRLCMASSVAGHRRAFGEDVVPGCYEDLELADLIVLVGSNTAWCHPVLFQRIVRAKRDNPKLRLVNIDPRRTATDESADLHLALRPGSDVTLFNGLLHYLRQHDKLDFAFLESHLEGYADALAVARETAPSVPAVARACGLPEQDVATFFQWFARTEKVVTAWSQGVNQSSSGSDKVNAILNVHLATGRIGRPGMGPFSLTGQPNAMGGREVGGLANQLAAHLELENPLHRAIVHEFWHSPKIPEQAGLKAVELFRAVREKRIQAVWIMATNPAISLPDVNEVRAALQACEFVVVSDCEDRTDLAPYADVRLPALGWGEKDGTVTNSERRISRQRAFLTAPGDAKPDWWAVAQVARRMGFADGFPYASVRDIFVEHARLSGFRNDGQRVFDISHLQNLTETEYDHLQPIQWPVNGRNPGGTARLFASGGFTTASARARMLPVRPRAPANPPCPSYPLVLNTGRIRDQWHTMTRTGKTPRLTNHIPEPYAEIHPQDAARFGIANGSLARLSSRHGEALARAQVSSDQQPGSVFLPMHWSDCYAKRGLANALVNPVVDPLSGEPEFKHTPMRIEAYKPAWYGFAFAREPLTPEGTDYEVRIRGDDYWLYEMAGESAPERWADWVRRRVTDSGGEWLEFADAYAGRYRCALLSDGRLRFCLFVDSGFDLPPRDWLAGLFTVERLPDRARMSLLAGKPASQDDDQGRVVCSCFSVGLNTLRRAIRQHSLSTPEEIGVRLQAGTNCGSCIPELKALLHEIAAA